MIHFLREPSDSDLPKDKNNELIKPYYPLQEDSEIKNEFECLINIIKEGGLRAGVSYRNRKKTIYGKSPVVCLTEMPLINFIQYSKSRNNKRITNYAIALLKKDVYSYGGRPVISGLSNDNNFSFENIFNRIIDPNVIPYKEQYRYVKLDLEKGNDWTHEREWRVKFEVDNFSIRDDKHNNSILTSALPIFSNHYFNEAIIILQNKKEAIEIQPIIQNQLDSGYCPSGQEFCNKIKYLILEDAISYLKNNSVTSIENLPNSVYYEHKYENISDSEKEKIHITINKCRSLAIKFANEFHNKTKLKRSSDGYYNDVGGWAHIRTDDIQNKYIRFLINEEIASSFSGGFVWLNEMEKNVPHLQCISYFEYIADKQIEILNKELGLRFYVDSRID
ncbi:hypothetical protein [Wenyingzhuangia sp. IMCC45467]